MPNNARKKYIKEQIKKQAEYKEKKKKAYHNQNIKEYPVNKEIELLEFLYQIFRDQSRNNVKSILSKRHVAVNGLPVTQFNYMLYKGDIVQVSKEQFDRTEVKKVEKKPRVKINIVYEDNDILVINKPNGLLTIESDHEKTDTAYKLVLEYMSQKDKHARCFQVHRLDKETSGLLLFTKTYELKELLSKNWNTLVKERGYVAVVEGKMPKKEDQIINWLKETDTHLMYNSNKNGDGLKAITNYKVVKETQKYSLLNVTIETGRKNQIRVAMADLGHPVVGDDKYGTPSDPLKRLGLHAATLKFKHPITKEIMYFKAETPAIFKKIFK
ncbi:MAG: RluA family pseudouridine synthase [Bacilli bacterium]|nr:RluA family pseudouridine synthase [Bacilli bacterium]